MDGHLTLDPIFSEALQKYAPNVAKEYSLIRPQDPSIILQTECLLELLNSMGYKKVIDFILATYKEGGLVFYRRIEGECFYLATPAFKYNAHHAKQALVHLLPNLHRWLSSERNPNELARILYFGLLHLTELQPAGSFQGEFLVVTPQEAVHIDFRTHQGVSLVVVTNYSTGESASGAFNVNSHRAWRELPHVQSVKDILDSDRAPSWARNLIEMLFINAPRDKLVNLPFGAPRVIYQLHNLVLGESTSVSVSFCFEDRSLVIVVKQEIGNKKATKFKVKVAVSDVEIQELPLNTSGIIFRVGNLSFSVFIPFPVDFTKRFFSFE